MSTFELEDYIVDKKRIGKGSFSIVYKAHHKYTKRNYAIKEISVDSIKKVKENIKREVKVMKNLNHDNIVKLHNVIIDKKYDNIYLVFDYYPLGDLANFLNKRPLKELYAQNYTKQLSSGLQYLYNNSIIHRDLKPQNILVTETYNIKITDFGFARYFDSDIMIQTLCGSPIYMAPEIMKNKQYNNKSDLWSVGIILYEMLTGQPPFKAPNILSLFKKIKSTKLQIPKHVSLSEEGKNLLFSLLQINPDIRIDWNDFFNHPWLKDNHILENENKFMEIDSIIADNSSLPNADEMRLSSLFYNFNHNSISKNSLPDDTIRPNKTNKKKNININESQNEEYNFSLSNIHFNSLGESNNADDGDESDDCSSDSSYISATDSNENIDYNCDNSKYDKNYVKSKPIPIKNSNNNYVYVTKDMLESKNPNNMFKSVMKQDYVLVPSNSPEYINSDPVGVSPSIKEVLNTSLSIIKASYEYISNKSI